MLGKCSWATITVGQNSEIFENRMPLTELTLTTRQEVCTICQPSLMILSGLNQHDLN